MTQGCRNGHPVRLELTREGFLVLLANRYTIRRAGDLGSIPGRVIPKTQKMVLDASLLNTQHYKVRIKGKVEQSREGVAPSPTHWCSSYRKGSLRVTLDYGRQLFYIYIYIYIYYPLPNHAHVYRLVSVNQDQRPFREKESHLKSRIKSISTLCSIVGGGMLWEKESHLKSRIKSISTLCSIVGGGMLCHKELIHRLGREKHKAPVLIWWRFVVLFSRCSVCNAVEIEKKKKMDNEHHEVLSFV